MGLTGAQRAEILSRLRSRRPAEDPTERALRTGIGIEQVAPPPPPPAIEFREEDPGFFGGLALDVINLPKRLGSLPGLVFRNNAALGIFGEMVTRKAEREGFSRAEARKVVFEELKGGQHPELLELVEPTEEERGGFLDLVTLAVPAGKLAAPIATKIGGGVARRFVGTKVGGALAERGIRLGRLTEQTIRGSVVGAKGAAVLPRSEEAGDAQRRFRTAAEGAVVGGALPVVGKAISPLGRVLAEQVGKLSQRGFGQKGTRRAQSRFLESKIVQAIRGRDPKKIVQEDLPALTNQLDELQKEVLEILSPGGKLIAQEAETIGLTGTVSKAAKATRASIARRLGGAESTLVSADKIRNIQQRAVAVPAGLRAIAKVLGAQAESEEARVTANVLLRRAAQVESQVGDAFAKASRSAGLTLRQFQVPVFADRALMEGALRDLNESVISFTRQTQIAGQGGLSPLQREINRVREGRSLIGAIIRGGVDFWRLNIFPLFSAGLDFVSNSLATTSAFKQAAAADLFDFVRTGSSSTRTRGLVRSVFSGAVSRANPQIEQRLVPTALGEKISTGFFGKDLFTFLFPDRDGQRMVQFGNRVVNVIDRVLFAPAAAKRGIDTGFKRMGAMAVLYEKALQEARKQGLQGSAKTAFVRGFVEKAPEEVIERAIVQGNKLGFNRSLSRIEEELAGSGNLGTAVKLFVTPFPRWQMQLLRWVGEHTPLDPTFWRRFRNGTATAEDFVQFLDRNTTGLLALLAVDELIYDNLDLQTLEYVREDGSRVSIGNIEPIPQAVAILAALKGDGEASFNAMRRTGTFGLRAEGIATSVIDEVPNLYSSDPERQGRARDRLVRALRGFIPGRGILRALRQISDPTEREGVLADVPIVSETLPPRIDPTTGEPLQRRSELPFFDIEIPNLGIPLSARKVNRVERKVRELRELDLRTRISLRPPSVGEIDGVNPDDVTPEIRRNFEKTAGRIWNKLVNELLDLEGFEDLPAEVQARAISSAKRDANAFARTIVEVTFPVQSLP